MAYPTRNIEQKVVTMTFFLISFLLKTQSLILKNNTIIFIKRSNMKHFSYTLLIALGFITHSTTSFSMEQAPQPPQELTPEAVEAQEREQMLAAIRQCNSFMINFNNAFWQYNREQKISRPVCYDDSLEVLIGYKETDGDEAITRLEQTIGKPHIMHEVLETKSADLYQSVFRPFLKRHRYAQRSGHRIPLLGDRLMLLAKEKHADGTPITALELVDKLNSVGKIDSDETECLDIIGHLKMNYAIHQVWKESGSPCTPEQIDAKMAELGFDDPEDAPAE